MLAPTLFAGDPFVTVEAQLGRAVFGRETGFMTSVNVVPSGRNTEAVEVNTVSKALFA